MNYKRKHLIFFAFTFFSVIFCKGQSLLWLDQIGGNNDDGIHGIICDDIGNVFVAGWFSGTADFDPSIAQYNLISNGGRDIFIAKYDSSGALLWAKGMGSSSQDEGSVITLDDSGNIIVGGRFSSNFDFDPGIGNTMITSQGSRDVYLSKFTPTGNLLWVKTFGGLQYDDCEGITTDNQNNIYLSGSYQSTVDFDPSNGVSILNSSTNTDNGYVVKFDSIGNYSWVIGFDGFESDDITRMKIDISGNLYITGTVSGTIDYDPGIGISSQSSNGLSDVLLAKYTTSGNLVWVKLFGGIGNDIGYSLDLKDDQIAICGSFSNRVDFDPSPDSLIHTSIDSLDIFVSRLDTSGAFLSNICIGGNGNDVGMEVRFTTNSDLIVDSYISNAVTCIIDTSLFTIFPNGMLDILFLKIDSAGYILSANNIGGTGIDFSRSFTINRINNNILMAGVFSNVVDFDVLSAVNFRTSLGLTDAFILEWDSSRCVPYIPMPIITGNTIACAGDSVTLSVQNLAGITYNWILPPGWIGYSTSNTISIKVGSNSGNIVMIESTICAVSMPGIFSIQVLDTTLQEINVEICQNDSTQLPNGLYVHSSGIYTSRYNGANGCDSTINVILTVNTPPTTSNYQFICQGSLYIINNHIYTLPGIYFDTLVSGTGCDSIVQTYLFVNPTISVTDSTTICNGDTIYFNGIPYYMSTLFNDTLSSASGCDSIVNRVINTRTVDTGVVVTGSSISAQQNNANYQWVECGATPTPIPGANTQVYTPGFNGNFAVIVEYNGCIDTSDCYIFNNTTFLSENYEPIYNIFLNPYTNILKIESKSILKRAAIYNLSGQIIMHQELHGMEETLNLQGISDGLYFINILMQDDSFAIKKILKSHK